MEYVYVSDLMQDGFTTADLKIVIAKNKSYLNKKRVWHRFSNKVEAAEYLIQGHDIEEVVQELRLSDEEVRALGYRKVYTESKDVNGDKSGDSYYQSVS